MDSSTIAHDLHAREWRQIILEANNSDIPKSQYIREHHLSENSFYYWQRLFRKEAVVEKTDLPSVSSLTAAFEKDSCHRSAEFFLYRSVCAISLGIFH